MVLIGRWRSINRRIEAWSVSNRVEPAASLLNGTELSSTAEIDVGASTTQVDFAPDGVDSRSLRIGSCKNLSEPVVVETPDWAWCCDFIPDDAVGVLIDGINRSTLTRRESSPDAGGFTGRNGMSQALIANRAVTAQPSCLRPPVTVEEDCGAQATARGVGSPRRPDLGRRSGRLGCSTALVPGRLSARRHRPGSPGGKRAAGGSTGPASTGPRLSCRERR